MIRPIVWGALLGLLPVTTAMSDETAFLSATRQLTFEGRRAGESYFSRDGQQLVFQSEREAGNPFFQIYLMDLKSGDTQRVSPGGGKTTCAWVHPTGRKVLFASTHEDPQAAEKQAAEFRQREEGRQSRYSWDYDEQYELYAFDLDTQKYERLTHARGYDAEASWSPDGQQIVFASNRQAHERELSGEEQAAFERDPSVLMDLYIMNADGSGLRSLTRETGYDGGPFFSPDGQHITWRHFSADGATAEIFTMRIDGTQARQLTRLGAMSWAPFYHPSGKYLIFTTNVHGFANFELYLVDAEGKSPPVRVTTTEGFDGLASFSPDGNRLAWTSNRTDNKQSQVFWADWNHPAALAQLGLDSAPGAPADDSDAIRVAREEAERTRHASSPEFVPADITRHVDYLCRPELEGRLTGTPGEIQATAYVAAYLNNLGLRPAGDDGTYFQAFSFTAGVALGPENRLTDASRKYTVDRDWRPLSFSENGTTTDGSVAFAGYGIVAPASQQFPEYDSYVHLDVRDKWVLAFRFMPEDVPAEKRQHLARYASLRHKAMMARERGARGLILVSGPKSQVKSPLVPLRLDGAVAGSGLPVLCISDEVAQQWLAGAKRDLAELQTQWDNEQGGLGFEIPELRLTAAIDIQRVQRTGRNVLARLQVGETPKEQTVLVGAHVDHLGKGTSPMSMSRDDDEKSIHYGADDNASGVAGMLEIAQYLADEVRRQPQGWHRDMLFAAWSGEELGLLGSRHFVEHLAQEELHKQIAAYINLDMVGRLDRQLILHGVGSSSIWRGEVEQRNVPVGLVLQLEDDRNVPTDAQVFAQAGVPILSAFTGSHPDYHTPQDTPEKLNYDGAARIARLLGLITRSVAMRAESPEFIAQKESDAQAQPRAYLRAYLGTVPDYAKTDIKGVRLSAVAKNGPAEKAGLKGGDTIVEVAGRRIDNIYDYTYAIEALKVGQPIRIIVQRGEERLPLEVTPGSRE